MPPLDPRLDFRDEDGRPAWLANRATWGLGRTVRWRAPRRGVVGWIERASCAKLFCWGFFGVIGTCILILVGGLGGAFLLSLL